MDAATEEFDFVEKIQVGITYEGRPIQALHIRGSGSSKNPAIYVDSLIHSREWISGAASMFVFKQVIKNCHFHILWHCLSSFQKVGVPDIRNLYAWLDDCHPL